ncbi:Rha family transcriptional regulator [Abyssalbus ytuae]|uniref:Phage regulatory protein/antirepressor Ant n=1 Tax=Abyssalbus ytuae TaxID=2926907 RepID=A0A9E7D478_9FLAO|nr:phage regulatory protein/antirepressor Ant [Abyssalbus ytuae]UOB18609.1 phage regulatory protein/antirepressor Ant [Abyssalbus ytuae]
MNLVIEYKGKSCTTSRLISEKFNKQHKDVLKSIRNLQCSNEFIRRNFALSSYMNDQNRKMPEYVITKDGFSFLVMGFTGTHAAKFKEDYINAFNEMEARLRNSISSMSRADLLRLALRQEEEKERLLIQTKHQEKQLKESAHKVQFHDKVLNSNSTYNINLIAKELGMSAVTLNRLLNEKRIQYKQNGTWVLYEKYQNRGYTKTKTYTYTDSNGNQLTSVLTVWTELGRKFIHFSVSNDFLLRKVN